MSYGCDTCDHAVMRLTRGDEHTCPDCGQEWVRNETGVFPVEELPA